MTLGMSQVFFEKISFAAKLQKNLQPKPSLKLRILSFLAKSLLGESPYRRFDFAQRVAHQSLHGNLQAGKASQEIEHSPKPLDAVVFDVPVDDHYGLDGVCRHEYRSPPARRHPFQLEHKNTPVMDKALKYAKDEHAEGKP